MYRVLTSFFDQHDPALVALAAIVSIAGAVVAIRLFTKLCSEDTAQFWSWLFLAGMTAGTTIWTTHLIALLGYAPGAGVRYDPFLIILSLLVGIAFSSIGLTVAATNVFRRPAELGGALVGLGIAATHFTGMTALRTGGIVERDWALVGATILLGALIAAAAFNRAVHGSSRGRSAQAGGLLAFGICLTHFTAMAALHIIPDAAIRVPGQLMSRIGLGIALAAAALLVIGAGIAISLIDRRSSLASQRRMRELADAAVEGVVLTDSHTILDVNSSFEAMAGRSREELIGFDFFSLLSSATAAGWALRRTRFESELLQPGKRRLPVEVVARRMTAQEPRHIFAVRDLTERREAAERISYLAHHDSLTRLPNRASLMERLGLELQRCRQRRGALAVLCIDLDRFKEVNDIFGHAAGDCLLVTVTQRMKDVLGTGEFLARLGGDEFVVLQSAADQPSGARDLAARLLACVEESFRVCGQPTHVGMSIGVAIHPQDGADASQVLANADIALYRAKADRGSSICFFERAMDEAVRRRLALAQELKEAITCGELELHYQPQSMIASTEIAGFETLVRWRHPRCGLIPAGEFIGLAEQTGLILPIGEWVLRTACRDAASWDRPLRVSVNLSALQLVHGDLPALVHQILLETGLKPARLELEIAETSLVRDPERALHVLRRLKPLGVSIVMDDFGAGYSSLSTLRAFPFDKIKIDGSLVSRMEAEPQAAAIVCIVVGLGRSLGVPVLAEGVETEGQLRLLAAEACEEAQGYLIGRPAGIEALTAMTAEAACPSEPAPLKRSA